MKKSSIIGVLILCFAFWGKAQVRNEIRVPDPEGYRTLKCDFHIHTVFSDGLVWPTVRVDEAYREGLDAIALTEHLEYRPHRQDIIASHNRSYEIAEKTARNNQVILIRGSEITRPMAPGQIRRSSYGVGPVQNRYLSGWVDGYPMCRSWAVPGRRSRLEKWH